MTQVNTPWVPLEIAEGIVEQAIREVLEPRFLAGSVAEATALARRRMRELHEKLGRLDVSHCKDGPVTRECPLACLHLPARQHNAIRYSTDAPRTIGGLLDMVRAGRLSETRNVGPASQQVVSDALRAAGFRIRHSHPHPRQGASGD
ncbi:hypothetical protein [Actinomadura algeriensis]|uniref:Uncharacterized protein n=1 Tax=Actinomadura algeriensis TaxID=1679523 RepID=A0ABR9JIJ4_9ACTN|nr:hypothetical protein [Actinomadura algeriensis]MBE1530365.1 hypothetical protein [Actinomadura algeriensis]